MSLKNDFLKTGVAKVINESLEKFFPDASKVKIISEPGTYFAEKSFTLVASVHSKNVKIDENGKETVHYYITDGMYQSFAMNATHGVDVAVETLEKYSGVPKNSIIWGRACDPHDIVLRDVLLPEMKCGDWLVFYNSGAYRLTTSSFFNGFPNHPVYSFIERSMWYVSNENFLILSKNKQFFRNTLKKMKVPHIDMPYDVVE